MLRSLFRMAVVGMVVAGVAVACNGGLEPESIPPICAPSLVGLCGTVRFRLRRQLRQPAAGDRLRHMHRAVAALLFLLAPVPAAAQGIVRGTVHDRDGAPISGASVAIPGTTLSTRCDLQGVYRIAVVPAGRVRVYAAALGYVP